MTDLITNGDHQHDRLSILAAMLWPSPDQEAQRSHFVAANVAHQLLQSGESQYTLDAGLVNALLDAPSWPTMAQQIEVQTKRATIAGYIFAFTFLMDQYSHLLPNRGGAGGTLDKAYYLAEAWAKTDVTYGDGTALYASEKSIKDCWREFRPVAHFWAATELNKAPGIQFIQPREIFSLAGLPRFLETASYLQCYGLSKELTNKSKGVMASLISTDTAWLLDTQSHKPRILLPADEQAISAAPWMTFLQSYAARKK